MKLCIDGEPLICHHQGEMSCPWNVLLGEASRTITQLLKNIFLTLISDIDLNDSVISMSGPSSLCNIVLVMISGHLMQKCSLFIDVLQQTCEMLSMQSQCQTCYF